MKSFERQPLNVRPYSKTATILFMILHAIAIGCHIASFIAGAASTPNDILVYPLAGLTRTRTEIVGPCLGTGATDNQCEKTKLDADGNANYPITIGTPSQPRCTSVEIQDGLSCGVDERHQDGKFSIKISEEKRQDFDEINIFGLYVWIDLLSIVFHGYAIVMTYFSAFQDVPSAIAGMFKAVTSLCKKADDEIKEELAAEESIIAKLESPTHDQRHSPNYPRAPEYNRRWLDIALCFGLLTLATALSVGITNFFTLALLFISIQIIGFLGFLVDDARYQLRITDSDAYNKNELYTELYEMLQNTAQCIDTKRFGSTQLIMQKFRRMRPLDSGWTQPIRNIGFCVGLQIIIWYFVTFTIVDAADNIIIQLDKGDDALGGDAFKQLASIYRWLTGIIGFYQLLVIIGDLVAEDRTKATVNPPGNFLLDQLDGDACFVILMFVTKIVVTWMAISTITEVYNFAGGKETRNGIVSDTYLDRDLDGGVVRTLMLILGVAALLVLSLFNWFLTPSSYVYCYVGLQIERGCCKRCLPSDERGDTESEEANPQGLYRNSALKF